MKITTDGRRYYLIKDNIEFRSYYLNDIIIAAGTNDCIPLFPDVFENTQAKQGKTLYEFEDEKDVKEQFPELFV